LPSSTRWLSAIDGGAPGGSVNHLIPHFQLFRRMGAAMELAQIRYFLALCKEQSFSRAAQRCGVAQPSLSNAIKRLEQELGGPLFHRGRLNCRLTALGQAVRPHLAKLDRCARDVRRQAARLVGGATARDHGFATGAIDRPAIHPAV
jgi:DNA-binding transcriptional LysR family regulator